MSFSSSVKDEIAAGKLKGERNRRALLAAATNVAGTITIVSGGMGIRYISETYSVGKLVSKLACSLYPVQCELFIKETETGRKNRSVIADLSGEGCGDIIRLSGLMDYVDDAYRERMKEELICDAETIKSYVKGAFLSAGSVSNPEKAYHLEMVCRHEGTAQFLCELLESLDIPMKYFERRGSYVVYTKGAETIFSLLALMEASDSAIKFENARMLKTAKNDVVRITNYENANMQKTAKASAWQLICIEKIRTHMGLEKLPQALRDVAEARINNEEASLSELAAMLDIGKSGVNHRLKKLIEIAEGIDD